MMLAYLFSRMRQNIVFNEALLDIYFYFQTRNSKTMQKKFFFKSVQIGKAILHKLSNIWHQIIE